jgi:uroporphyrinogen decarboxylase
MTETLNMKEWVSFVMNSEKRLAIPIMTHPGIDLIGERVINAVTEANIHFRAINAMNEYFPSAASTIIMDLTVEAEAFGCKINFTRDEVPAVMDRLVNDLESVENLKVPDLTHGRMKEYIGATRLSVAHIHEKPVFAGCIGPFSLAGRLFDMTSILTDIYLEPDTVFMLLQKCTSFLTEYVKAFKMAGASGIIMAEPAAGLLPPEMCNIFSSAFVKSIVDEVQDDNFLVILHNCGRTNSLTQSMLSTGVRGLHLGNATDIVRSLEEIPSEVLVLGNLDPVSILKNSTPDEVEEATLSLLERTRQKRNFILSSGCDTPPGVPFANIRAFYNSLAKYNIFSLERKFTDSRVSISL